MSRKVYSLFQLSKSIKNLLRGHAFESYWVKAEILKLNYSSQSGHAYPDLVDKRQDTIKAQFRGTIWSSNFEKINNKFKLIGEQLKDDMQVVIKVSINYHNVYGLSLNIVDVDTEYTLGELARQKQECIKRLKSENLFQKNKQLLVSAVPKVIAVISVDSSKGYKDFLNVLEQNEKKYVFHHRLFPAVLQGDKAIQTISNQLKLIGNYQHIFDAVAIIRGGGDEVGFSAYDHYNLTRNITECPLPVLTGIGHSTNLTVSEMVANKSFITPTKLAEYLIEKYEKFSLNLNQSVITLQKSSRFLIQNKKQNLESTLRLFTAISQNSLKNAGSHLLNITSDLLYGSKRLLITYKNLLNQTGYKLDYEFKNFIKSENLVLQNFNNELLSITKKRLIKENEKYAFSVQKISDAMRMRLVLERKDLDFFEKRVQMHHPKYILNMGYTVTRVNGKALKNIEKLKEGDTIETQFQSGKIESRINKLKK